MADGNFSRNNFRVTPNSEQIPIQVVGSSTFGRYDKIASGLTYNMFISDDWLVNFAGYKKVQQFISDNVGSGRGLFHSTRGDLLIVVINANVFKLEEDLEPIPIGTLATTSGEVFIDENLNNQICIVDGQDAWIYNYQTAAVMTKQTLTAGLAPGYVCFHNTYFLFGNANTDATGAFWYAYGFNSAVNPPDDQQIILITQFSLSTKPDYAIAVRRLPGQGNNVIVFGNTVCEIWTQIGGIQNYRRNASTNIDYGCLSISTIATCDQYTAWLAINEDNSPIILVYNAQGIKRISTDGIDYLMDNLKFPQQSTALFFTQDGHLFYQLTFFNKEDDLTLLYDFNTEKFFNLSDHDGTYHPARKMVYFLGTPYFISLKNASLYKSDTSITVYNENLSDNPLEWQAALVYPIARTRVCESIRKPDSGRFVVNSFVFTMDQGNDPLVTDLSLFSERVDGLITQVGADIVGQAGQAMISENSIPGSFSNVNFTNPTTLVYQPRVDLAFSKDSGITWSNYVARPLNAVGRRRNIITWNNMGMANDFTIKLRFWGTSAFIVQNGMVEVY